MKILKVAFFLLLIPVIYYAFDRFELFQGTPPATILSKEAPNFSLDGFELKTLKGKPVVLHFWATWCGPCVVELPELVALSRSRPEIEFVAVSVDRTKTAVDFFFRTHPDLTKHGSNLRFLIDTQGAVSALYNTDQYPESYLITRNFTVDNKLIGAQPWLSGVMKGLLERITR
ncbi:MAG TPA: TlpA disulfide reductase family protein [Bdellovibrionota bacterium]